MRNLPILKVAQCSEEIYRLITERGWRKIWHWTCLPPMLVGLGRPLALIGLVSPSHVMRGKSIPTGPLDGSGCDFVWTWLMPT